MYSGIIYLPELRCPFIVISYYACSRVALLGDNGHVLAPGLVKAESCLHPVTLCMHRALAFTPIHQDCLSVPGTSYLYLIEICGEDQVTEKTGSMQLHVAAHHAANHTYMSGHCSNT